MINLHERLQALEKEKNLMKHQVEDLRAEMESVKRFKTLTESYLYDAYGISKFHKIDKFLFRVAEKLGMRNIY